MKPQATLKAKKQTLAAPTLLPLLLLLPPLVAAMTLTSCASGTPPAPQPAAAAAEPAPATLQPLLVTEPVAVDADDPAIWIHPEDPLRSLVIGTDKGGSLYVFDLEGKIIPGKTFDTGGRFNNVDVEYGFELAGEEVDIAVATDRPVRLLRVLRLPEMTPIDNGGIPVFEGEVGDAALPMGIALYKRPTDGAVFAVVSRKTGPSGSYLWQYRLEDDGSGRVQGTKVREFGTFSDATSMDEGVPELGEIESVAVDDALGFVYYSDELTGVRKYRADPDAPDANVELALFGTEGFAEQREGISIYTIDGGTGYILVSDQQGNAFRIFKREGEPGAPHDHRLLKVVRVSTNESDGSEVTSAALGPRFPSGLFVAMSDNRTFHYYSWEDIAGGDLEKAPNGVPPAP
jgi:3-phytase